jgi:hypothetical protein
LAHNNEVQFQEILFQADEYKHRAEKYLGNANEAIKKQELAKAGEFLWGAISSIISAIGALYKQVPRNHKEIVESGKRLAIEVGDQDMYQFLNREAQALHANFYHEFLNEETFNQSYDVIMRLYGKIETIFEKELQKKNSSI